MAKIKKEEKNDRKDDDNDKNNNTSSSLIYCYGRMESNEYLMINDVHRHTETHISGIKYKAVRLRIFDIHFEFQMKKELNLTLK